MGVQERDATFEILEFCVGEHELGVDISEVTEIFVAKEVSKMPCCNPAVEGIFMFRGITTPVIDMCKIMQCDAVEQSDGRTMFIVCTLSSGTVAFHVSSVKGIESIETTAVRSMESVFNNNKASYVKELVSFGDRIVLLLDLEKVVSKLDINMDEVRQAEVKASTEGKVSA